MAPRRLAPGLPHLATTHHSRELKLRLWVFCEGEATEIGWLEHLRQRCRDVGVQIIPAGGCGVPFTVAQLAVDKRKSLPRARTAIEARDEVWAVFDRDSHPKVPESISLCREEGVGLAFSNACFELWPLLHFEDVHANKGRADLQTRLHQLHPPYHHERGARVDWEKLLPDESQAADRAIRLHLRLAKRQEGLFDNPWTTAWILHQRLVQANDHDALWLLDLCRENPALAPLVDNLPEPLRSRARKRMKKP